MDVSMVVDEQTEGVGTAVGVVILVILHDRLVDKGVLISRLVHEPVDDTWDDNGDVLHVLLEIWIILIISTLVKVRNVNKVPVRLPASTTVLYNVSKSSAFHKSMIAFSLSQILVGHNCENILSSLKSSRVLL